MVGVRVLAAVDELLRREGYAQGINEDLVQEVWTEGGEVRLTIRRGSRHLSANYRTKV